MPQTHLHNISKRPFSFHFRIQLLWSLLNSRFGDLASQSIQSLKYIPSHATGPMEQETVEEMLRHYKEGLPSPNSFHQEVKLWQHMSSCQDSKPDSQSVTLADSLSVTLADSLSVTLADSRACPTIFPNITKSFNFFLHR